MIRRLGFPGQNKLMSLPRRSFDIKSRSVYGGRHNRCVIVSAKLNMIAETIDRKGNVWYVQTRNAQSDLVIQVGKRHSFHLHTLPMMSRCGYLSRTIFAMRNNNSPSVIQLENFPGGAEIFELIVKFCYGWKVDLKANNVAPVYCAAHVLEMTDDYETGNLISRAETFLSFVMFSSWKDTFHILKTCESISSWARELQIQKRCSEAIAWKVCADPKAIGIGRDDAQCLYVLANVTVSDTHNTKPVAENWWFEDASLLRIDHFVEVVGCIRKKGMKPDLLGSCIAYWTAKWLSRISFGPNNLNPKYMDHQVIRVILESLIRITPAEKNSVPCNFLLHLLKVGLMMKIDVKLSEKLESRIVLLLEQCQPLDLLVKNYGESATAYDARVIARVVQTYLSDIAASNPASKFFVFGRLVDGYLMLIARDENLPAVDFQQIAEALPKNARYSDDNLYKAVDLYLKAHPELREEERYGVCKALEYHKLSQDARAHAARNDRLSMSIMAQFALLEQVNMAKSMIDGKSKYKRTKAQLIVRVDGDRSNEWIKCQKQLRMMKQEVEGIKMQLSKVQLCKTKLEKVAHSVW